MTRFLLLSVALGLAAPSAHAQGILGRARQAVQRGAERAVEREGDRRADAAVTRAIGDVAGDAPAPESVAAPGSEAAPASAGAFVNYDFVPGDRIVFADDLTAETVGDFPRRLTFGSGTFETAEWQGRRFLRATAWGGFSVPLPETLPERFTFEFEAAIPHGTSQEIHFGEGATHHVSLSLYESGIDGTSRAMTRPAVLPQPDAPFLVKVMADGAYVKVYVNGTRVANMPNASLGRDRQIRFVIHADQTKPVYYGDFRVAAGGRDLRTVAEAVVEAAPAAPLVLHGVTFETASATLRPESGPTLDAVAASLAAHPGVRVRVEGHTDDTGSATTNRTLSEARARSVVAYLAARGVDAGRMEAVGFGPDQPVAPNTTPEGRQQNRRVALVRL